MFFASDCLKNMRHCLPLKIYKKKCAKDAADKPWFIFFRSFLNKNNKIWLLDIYFFKGAISFIYAFFFTTAQADFKPKICIRDFIFRVLIASFLQNLGNRSAVL